MYHYCSTRLHPTSTCHVPIAVMHIPSIATMPLMQCEFSEISCGEAQLADAKVGDGFEGGTCDMGWRAAHTAQHLRYTLMRHKWMELMTPPIRLRNANRETTSTTHA